MTYGDEMTGDGMMGGSGMMGSGEMYGDEMYGDGSGMGGAKAPTEDQVKTKLLTRRYVDLTGEPQAADSEPYAEFRLMPVHIAVLMDQQKLPDFLVNLANCEMPVDVKQVSIQASGKANFATGAASGGGSGEGMMDDFGGGSMMGGYGGGGSDYGGETTGGYAGDTMGYAGAGGAVSAASDEAKQDIPIEIFGVIRIFNPPDMEKLGTGSGPTPATPTEAPTVVQPTTPGPESESEPAPGPAPAPEPNPTPTPTPTPTPSPVPPAVPTPTGETG
jgi:hypothetical protein